MQTSSHMGLVIWDDLDDAYDHNQLAANWQAVDDHDHTPGRGVQIPSAGLQDFSVTNTKLATDSVTTSKILNGTILGEDIASGAIGIAQLSSSIFSKLVPLGMVTPWFRPTTSISVPDGWVICDGSVVTGHGWSGGGGVTVPDLRNAFVLGSALSGTGTGLSTPPAEKATGGNHNRTWNHSHTVAGHSHTVNNHTHVVDAHVHWVPNHAHGISADGSHNHTIHSRQTRTLRQDQTGNDSFLQTLYIAGFNSGGGDALAPSIGNHSHGGATGGAAFASDVSSPGTSGASPGTSSTGLTTDATSVGGDIRPNFVGLLYIIKVRDPS